MFFLRCVFCLSISFSLLFAPSGSKHREKKRICLSQQQYLHNIAKRNNTQELSDEELSQLIKVEFIDKNGKYQSIYPCPREKLTVDLVARARRDARVYLDSGIDFKERKLVLEDLWQMRLWLEAHGGWDKSMESKYGVVKELGKERIF